jgi:hypothetical protein
VIQSNKWNKILISKNQSKKLKASFTGFVLPGKALFSSGFRGNSKLRQLRFHTQANDKGQVICKNDLTLDKIKSRLVGTGRDLIWIENFASAFGSTG